MISFSKFKNKRIKIKLTILCLICLLAAIASILYIYNKVEDINGNIGYDKMNIRIRDFNLEKRLRQKHLSEIKESLGNELITYYTYTNMTIHSEFNSEMVQIYGVGGDFKEFYHMNINGSFIREDSNKARERVLVLQDKTAYKLFGSADIVGLTTSIEGQDYRIIGVVSFDEPLEQRLNNGLIGFIPLSAMEEDKINITNIEIAMKNIDSREIKDIIKVFSIDNNNFIIEDFNIVGIKIAQRMKLLIFLFSCIIIVILLKLLFSNLKSLVGKMKTLLESDYLSNIIFKQWKSYIPSLLISIFLLVTIFIIWRVATFDMYIDPSIIPDDPTSLSQIISIIKKRAQIKLMNAHRLYIFPIYRKSKDLVLLSQIFYYIGLISLIILLKLSLDRASYKNK